MTMGEGVTYYPPQNQPHGATSPQGTVYYPAPQGIIGARPRAVVLAPPVKRTVFRLDYGRLDIDYLG